MKWTDGDIHKLIQIWRASDSHDEFSIWICAHLDQGGKRFWKSEKLVEGKPIIEISGYLEDLLNSAFVKVSSWKRDHLEFACHLNESQGFWKALITFLRVKFNSGKFACPCCGYKTLSKQNNYEICRVCWWEDDGQDSQDADEIRGGANGDLSLTRARANFIDFGISKPDRSDLIKGQMDHFSFKRVRIFTKTADGKITEK